MRCATNPRVFHDGRKRYAVVSCHVERPLDDRVWTRFARIQERRPGGFRIAALMRPPDPASNEDGERWLARAREAAARGPFGLHTHWTAPDHARPTEGEPAARVRRELDWLGERGLEPTLFAGGGWYIDADVAAHLAERGLADCTGTSFRPRYLPPGAARLGVAEPCRIVLPGGAELVELPATHSLGALVRGVLRPLAAPLVHAYFHDTDLLDRRRSLALRLVLVLLGRRRVPTDLDRAREAEALPPAELSSVFGR